GAGLTASLKGRGSSVGGGFGGRVGRRGHNETIFIHDGLDGGNRGAIADPLKPVDDQTIAIGDTIGDEPVIARDLAHRKYAGFHLVVVRRELRRKLPPRIARGSSLRDQVSG